MRKTLTVLASCLTILTATTAFSADGTYFSINTGLAKPNDSSASDSSSAPGLTMDFNYTTEPVAGVALGYKAGELRFEGELEYQKSDFDELKVSYGASNESLALSGDVTATSFLVNGYYDFATGGKFTPYITAGIGGARLGINDVTVSAPGYGTATVRDSDYVFAYQIGAGVGYTINERVILDLKYRYFASEDPDFGEAKAEFATHNILLGLRIGL